MFPLIILTEKENTKENRAKVRDTIFHVAKNKQKEKKTSHPPKKKLYETVSSLKINLCSEGQDVPFISKLYCLVHKNRSTAPVRGTEYHDKSPIPFL